MSAPDDDALEGAPRPPDGADSPRAPGDAVGTTAPADADADAGAGADGRPRTLRTLRSPLPPPPQVPGIAPMPEMPRAGAQSTQPQPVPPAISDSAPPTESGSAATLPLGELPPLVPPAPAMSPLASEGDGPEANTAALPPLSPQGEGPEVRTPIAGYGQQVERGTWLRRDKVEANDPSDDEVLLHVEGSDGWAIVGASRIGRSHLHDGKYREDGLAAAITPSGWHLVAVADGGGSYRLARVGAPLAASAAVSAMRTALEGNTENAESAESRGGRGEEKRSTAEGTEDTEEGAEREVGTAEGAKEREGREDGEQGITAEDAEEEIEVRARAALVTGMRAAWRALEDEAARRRAAGDEAVTVADLRTTLLLALHRALPDGGQLVAGAQVGDGLIAARKGTEGGLHALGVPETGAIGDETMFLPDVPDEAGVWESRARLARLGGAAGPVHLLVLTDGVSDDFAPAADHLWRLERPLFASALTPGRPPAEAAAALRDLLGYERAGSFDDRTLVCIYRPSPAP